MPTKPTAKKKGHRPQQFTEEQVAQAVTEAKGMVTAAACRLGCNPSTIYDYFKRYPDLKVALNGARESAIDFVESSLMKAIEEGSYRFTGMLQNNGRKISIEYTEDRVAWDYGDRSRKCRVIVRKKNWKRATYTFTRN